LAQDSLYLGLMPIVDGKVTYSKIFSADSLKKNDLFAIVKEYTVKRYNSEKSALQSEDKEAGFISYRGTFSYIDTLNFGLMREQSGLDVFDHRLTFYVKDGKVEME
jgi:hypothetical protein